MHGGMLLIPKEQAQAKYTASVFLFNEKMRWSKNTIYDDIVKGAANGYFS